MKKPSTMVIKCMGKLMANWEANAAIVEHLRNKNITSKIFQNKKKIWVCILSVHLNCRRVAGEFQVAKVCRSSPPSDNMPCYINAYLEWFFNCPYPLPLFSVPKWNKCQWPKGSCCSMKSFIWESVWLARLPFFIFVLKQFHFSHRKW